MLGRKPPVFNRFPAYFDRLTAVVWATRREGFNISGIQNFKERLFLVLVFGASPVFVLVLVLSCLFYDGVFLKIAEGRRVVRTRIRSRAARIRAERTRVGAIVRATTSRADTKTF